MAAITIRQLEDSTKASLRIRAATNGRSMEAEAREILRCALARDEGLSGKDLVESIRQRFAPFGAVELKIPKRTSIKPPPDFREPLKRRRSK